jgi:ribosomal protein S18 acetylase RimI-like enzyme
MLPISSGQPEPAPLSPAFRLAEQADIDTLVELMRQFNAIDAYPFDAQVTRAALERFIGDPALGRLWLIQMGDAAIGYLALTFGYSFEYHGRDAFIDELYLLPGYRGQGIGTRAMRFAIAACRELGVHALHLEVERHNAAARRLYRRAGFEEHDRYLLTRWIEEEAGA